MLQTIPQTAVTEERIAHGDGASAAVRAALDQARNETRRSEERLEMLLQTSGDGLWDWNLRTDELYVSDRWSQIVGLPQGAIDGNVAAVWLSYIHEEHLDDVMRAIYAHLRGDVARFEIEYRVKCANGETRWVHSRGIARRDERGQPLRMVGSHRDIGERKRAEDRIRESQDIIRRNEERFRAMIENGSDLITLVDSQGRITYQSPSITRVLGYTPEEMIGTSIIDLIKSDDHALIYERAGEAVKRGEQVFSVEVRARDRLGNERWLEVVGSTRPESSVGSLIVLNSRDITERQERKLWLEAEVAKRTRELQTLLTINRTVSSTLDLSSLLETILDTATAVVEYDVVDLFELDETGNRLRLLTSRGGQTRAVKPAPVELELTAFDRQIIESRKPMILNDIGSMMPDARAALKANPHGGSWMCLPLIVRDRVLGVMTFDTRTSGYYTDQLANLAMAFASQAAAAIENARLYAAEQTRLKIAEGMREQVRMLNSKANHAEIYDRALQQIGATLDADSGAIFERDRESKLLTFRQGHAISPQNQSCLSLCMWLINRSLEERHVVVEACDIAGRLRDADEESDRVAQLRRLYVEGGYRRVMAIPLISDREMYGGIVLFFKNAPKMGHEYLAMAATVGYQSALGIENTRLREEAARNAIAQERYRIARDLHDSVSQALYGISLGARTARQTIAPEETRTIDAIDYVLELAEGGLSEMRALLLELQPESLQTEGLVVVLQKQLIALCARHKLKLDTRFDAEPVMPVKTKEALYRIIMEAMQNTVKHANAKHVRLDMSYKLDPSGQRRVVIVLEDDGRGFDATKKYHGHMGLDNMRSRAEGPGGTFDLQSDAGKGTRVCVTMPTSDSIDA
jgi:PAS domain S-box-containing protein